MISANDWSSNTDSPKIDNSALCLHLSSNCSSLRDYLLDPVYYWGSSQNSATHLVVKMLVDHQEATVDVIMPNKDSQVNNWRESHQVSIRVYVMFDLSSVRHEGLLGPRDR